MPTRTHACFPPVLYIPLDSNSTALQTARKWPAHKLVPMPRVASTLAVSSLPLRPLFRCRPTLLFQVFGTLLSPWYVLSHFILRFFADLPLAS
jgi:hypothetical protein